MSRPPHQEELDQRSCRICGGAMFRVDRTGARRLTEASLVGTDWVHATCIQAAVRAALAGHPSARPGARS